MAQLSLYSRWVCVRSVCVCMCTIILTTTNSYAVHSAHDSTNISGSMHTTNAHKNTALCPKSTTPPRSHIAGTTIIIIIPMLWMEGAAGYALRIEHVKYPNSTRRDREQ